MSGKVAKIGSKKVAVKTKEISNSATSSNVIDNSEAPHALSFPLLKTVDNARILPRYSSILDRPDYEGVVMEDIDVLQLELETLLSAAVVRARVLQDEVRILNEEEKKRSRKRKRSIHVANCIKKGFVKRSKNENKLPKKFCKSQKLKLVASPIKFTNVKPVSLVTNIHNQNLNLPGSEDFDFLPADQRVVNPKNATANKFWAFVEPYYTDVTADDINILKDLIVKHENVEYLKIPKLGTHYKQRWQSEVPQEEQATCSRIVSTHNIAPLTQRLVSALLEENNPHDKKSGLLERSTAPNLPTVLRSFSINLERCSRKELQEQGIMNPPRSILEDDEILSDIKACQKKIKIISKNNLPHLRQLLQSAGKEIRRQELTKKLKIVDTEICYLYRKIQSNKLKKKPSIKREQEQAWKSLKDRERLIQEIDSI